MIRQAAFATLLTTALAGCTTIQLEPLPDGMTNQPPADWAQRSQSLSRFNQWQLSGKLAVKQPSDSGTAVINQWRQQGERYDLSLSSSFLGMGTTRLKGVPGFIELTLANGDTYRSSEPESLVAAATGWNLPIDNLTWWIRGLPAPDGDFRLLFDETNHLAILKQNGWEIRYDRWQGFVDDLPPLPARITALKDDKRVRVVISNWLRED
ncbi:lipoprotein insertase outer membrane protein LolB [Marinobacter daepoensis]|uniref:Outer-membrane lipoprotein LolB n=1 Tax=Marinobacter daepoensis TaxID=262077 RepID=A0ABS3BI54_9GAMM|nr:lipoprotein insertase outer membrane protein LolB [Marinobacter daepoensis]MBN7771504.1 outer membrane lipoprotein LolB [Marinobacter daepoensis]MBY6034226.1 lipoprotein insertase outer membrane protein LolB [Marinobacter daepoensis]MBY6080104.1 lipoprotein insertase outer membrane protein LolB [Marinobacter daepoensis]